MPYQIAHEVSFWNTSEIKPWKNILALIQNPNRDWEMLSLLKELPGIGQTTLSKITNHAQSQKQSLYESLQNLPFTPPETLQKFLRQLLSWQIWEKRYPIFSSTNSENLLEKMRNDMALLWPLSEESWQILTQSANSFSSISKFLEYMHSTKPVDDMNFQAEKISLLSLHAAKGLEFPVVFIVGCEQGILPYQRTLEEQGKDDEERRLFYVGITRAKEALFLTKSKQRTVFGQTQKASWSPYVEEIPHNLVENVQSSWKKKKANFFYQPELF
jgi:DNA helicase-2/ATP-dependent DNA helicase PcrA